MSRLTKDREYYNAITAKRNANSIYGTANQNREANEGAADKARKKQKSDDRLFNARNVAKTRSMNSSAEQNSRATEGVKRKVAQKADQYAYLQSVKTRHNAQSINKSANQNRSATTVSNERAKRDARRNVTPEKLSPTRKTIESAFKNNKKVTKK